MLSKSNLGKPLLSICCTTYNHEKYICDCLDGFLKQKTNFPCEIIINDDASTDRTPQIIKYYMRKFPGAIFPVFQTVNQYSKGVKPFIDLVLPQAKGKYIAICEGDDFWTDPLKLQKQVEFLEANPDYIVCYHNADIIDGNSKLMCRSKLPEDLKRDFTSCELIKGKTLLTLTMCFRNVLKSLPSEISSVHNVDTFLISILGNYGHGKYLNNIENAVYRKHSGSIWSSLDSTTQVFLNGVTRAWLHRYYKRIGLHSYAHHFKIETLHHFARALFFLRMRSAPARLDISQRIFSEFKDIVDRSIEAKLRSLLKSDTNVTDFKQGLNPSISIPCKFGSQDKEIGINRIVRCGKVEYEHDEILLVDWIITRRCNYKCSYCTVHDNKRGFFPDLSRLRKAVDCIVALQHNSFKILLAGGEPTLHPDYSTFVGYLSEKLNSTGHITTQTNLSRPKPFFEQLVIKLKGKENTLSFNASFHFDHANEAAFIENVRLLIDNGYHVLVKVCAHPFYMRQVKSLYGKLSKFENELLKLDIVVVRQNFGDAPDRRYSENDIRWFSDYHSRNTAKSMFIDFMSTDQKITRKYYTPDEIIVHGHNKFKGMLCSAGSNMISIDANGEVDPAVCFRTVRRNKPNIYISNEGLKKMDKSVICPFDACGIPSCLFNIKQALDTENVIRPEAWHGMQCNVMH